MTVLVTRPAPDGDQLHQQLSTYGFRSFYAPMITISKGKDFEYLPKYLEALKNKDIIIFVSKSAVTYTLQALKASNLAISRAIITYCVGRSTALYYSESTEMNTAYAYPQENSEGVLTLLKQQQLADKTILLLRGQQGRTLIQEYCQNQLATIYYLEIYHREKTQFAQDQINIWKQAGIKTIIATSSHILDNLHDTIPTKEHHWLHSRKLIVVSPRIMDIAKSLGWYNIVLAPRANNQSIIQTLLQFEKCKAP